MRRSTMLELYAGSNNGSGRLDDMKIKITPPDWEAYIQEVADKILAEQSPQKYLTFHC